MFGSNYRTTVSYKLRVPMRDATNALVAGIFAGMSCIVIKPDGTVDGAPPAVFTEVTPGVYQFLYTFALVGSYTFSLAGPGAVKTVFTENIQESDLDTLRDEVRVLRRGNMQIEFTFATAQVVNRKVEIGRVDYEEIKLKADSASDWTSPISTKRVYWWYTTLGDFNPVKIGSIS